jgi:hypothetical protein
VQQTDDEERRSHEMTITNLQQSLEISQCKISQLEKLIIQLDFELREYRIEQNKSLSRNDDLNALSQENVITKTSYSECLFQQK